jgi:hypothetical protein
MKPANGISQLPNASPSSRLKMAKPRIGQTRPEHQRGEDDQADRVADPELLGLRAMSRHGRIVAA